MEVASVIHRTNYTRFSAQSVRLKTYAVNYGRDDSNPQASAILNMNAGFIIPLEAVVFSLYCSWCDLELKDLHPSHSPLAWHRTHASKVCVYLRNNKSVNDKDLGIPFPEAPSVEVELSNVLPQSRGLQDDAESDVTVSGMQMEYVAPAGDGHVTLQRSGTDMADGGEESMSSSNEEQMKSYRSNARLQYLLPSSQIDVIKTPLIPIAERDYRYERNRRGTFVNFPRSQSVPPKTLAASGFIFTGVRDVVECFFCQVKVGEWNADKIPNKIHQDKNPSCHFIQGLGSVDNIPDVVSDLFDEDGAELRPIDDRQISIELGIITDSTRHPDFAVESRRQATFLTWPSTNNKLASEMIEHFLYYTGTSDTVCCFYCGVEMSKWTSIESIWVRHARQSPTCQLLLREQGQDFVTSVIRDHGRYQEPPKEPTINVVTTRMLRPRMDSPVAQSALQLSEPDYSRDDVRNALINNIKYGEPDFKTLADLIRAIQAKKEERRDLDRVREDIEQEPAPPIVVKPARHIIPEREVPVIEEEEEADRASIGHTSIEEPETEQHESSMEIGATSQPVRPRRLPTPPPVADPTGTWVLEWTAGDGNSDVSEE